MENASKALIMAASILIGVMIISIGVVLFNIFSTYSANAQKDLEAKQIGEFNEQFLKYVSYTNSSMPPAEREEKRVILTAHDVISIASLAKENNINQGFYNEDKTYTAQEKKSSATKYIQIDVIDKGKTISNFEDKPQDTYINFIKDNSVLTTSNGSTGQSVAKMKRYVCEYTEDVVISSQTNRIKYMKIRALD